MSVECTTCGHLIPAGQFRCGKCGALAPRESLEDFGGLTEGLNGGPTPPLVAAPATAAPAPRPTPPVRVEAEPPVKPPDQEASQQIETVPKGVFTSETPHVPFPAREELPPEPKPAPPREKEPSASASSSGSRVVSVAGSSSQRVKQLPTAHKPPYLASEILREDLTPLTPGKHAMAMATQLAGGLGLLGTLLLGYDSIQGLLLAAACATLIVLGRLKLEHTVRAMAVTGLAGLGLMAAATARVAMGAAQDDPVLAFACALLPGALLFRAWYRAAQRARVLVTVSLPLAFAWAAMTSHRGLLTLGFTWESWLPALAWSLFVILCLLSLLAFMGDETTGGCGAWAVGICIWFGLYAVLRAAMESGAFTQPLRSAMHALGLAEAAFAPPFAVGLAQLYARGFVSRVRTPSTSAQS